MDRTGRIQRGRETAMTIARKGARVLLTGLRALSVASLVANVVGTDDAVSTAWTMLTAVIEIGKNLIGLQN
ncbi:hypothetical protein ACTD5D_21345 [Nocardia takedensis]|uniref:hypothetical protein n=1 Tax=Nocardia takedensis TaxID=259390 RepID=UPI003F77033C